jgi:hypothetical protein
MPWRSLLGDHRVSGGGLRCFLATKRTPRRERGERVARPGSRAPTGSDRVRASLSFSGKATCVRRTDATSAGGLLTEEPVYAQGSSPPTPGALAHGQDPPRYAADSLEGGQAPSGSGRARQTVAQEVRSPSAREPRGAEARHAVGDRPTASAPAGGYAARPRAGWALRHPRWTVSSGPGGHACPDCTDRCTALS